MLLPAEDARQAEQQQTGRQASHRQASYRQADRTTDGLTGSMMLTQIDRQAHRWGGRQT